ncbi:MAG: NAD(P)-dependent oxidoreductase [Lachnospiraceae bacterium]|nr:NAD(P)-dependent oxidoreductase [Lachnospiraceae bacterium]
MKVLVTGANGYLGTGVVKQLLDDGVDVVATDIRTNFIDSRADIKEANLFELDDPYDYFGKPDVVLHMAWRDGFKHASLNHINDLPAHYSFLTKMATAGVDRICALGSMHEIGFYEGSINEDTPCKPQSLYGISKNALREATELLCKDNDVKFQWIRGFYIVGTSTNGSSIFAKIAQAAKDGKTEFPFTMGLNQFDFTDYELFCEQVAAVAEQEDVLGVINCCSGRPMTLAQRVEKFIEENGYNIKLLYGQFPDRPYDSKAIWGNDFKISVIMDKRHSKNS